VVHLDRLDWVQAQDDYVLLRTEGKSLLKQQTLASLETLLDPGRFIRIHRSYILNLDRLVRIEQDSKEHRDAILRDGSRLPVSRAGYQRLRELWEGMI
jgi:two-component system LytT family response regulator